MADLYDEQVQELFGRCITHFLDVSTQSSTSREIELCLTPAEDESGKIGYYFVDHEARTLFWLDVESGAFFPGDSAVHEWYWMHVEKYSAHLTPIPPTDIELLIDKIKAGKIRMYRYLSFA